MFAIKDEGSGCLLSERSFWSDDGEDWYLYGYTGKLGTSFASSRQGIEKVFKGLQERNNESRLNRILHIIEVQVDSLTLGQAVRIV